MERLEPGLSSAPAGSLGRHAENVLELLSGLASKSLVARSLPDSVPRYRLPSKALREQALEGLRAIGEEQRARDAYLACVARMCARAHREIVGGRMRETVAALAQDHGSISGALEHAAHSEATRPTGIAIVGRTDPLHQVSTDSAAEMLTQLAIGV